MDELLKLIRSGASESEVKERARQLHKEGRLNTAQVRQTMLAFQKRERGEPMVAKAAKAVGTRLWGGANAIGFDLLDDIVNIAAPGKPGSAMQDYYEENVPAWQRIPSEILMDLGLVMGTGGASILPKVAGKIAAKKMGKDLGEEATQQLGRTLMSPGRVAGEVAEGNLTRRSLLTGRSKNAAKAAGSDAREFVELGSQIPRSGGLGTARFADIVSEKGLMHPSALGAADMVGREAPGSFPLTRGLMSAGKKTWDIARHGRIRPGSYEDLSPSAHTLGDLFNRKRQLRFLEEGAVFGGLEGLGRSDLSESDDAGDAWKRGRRGVLLGSGVGAGGGTVLGNLMGLGQYVLPRVKHFKRSETSEEVMRNMLSERTGVRAGMPTKTSEEGLLQELLPGIDDAASTPFMGEVQQPVARMLGELRSGRGASSIPREITAGTDVLPTQPIRAGGLMAVGADLAQSNQDNLPELRNLFGEYIDELGERAVLRGDESLVDQLQDLSQLRMGDVPRRPRAGGVERDNLLTPELEIETPGAGHVLQPDLPATEKLSDLLGYTQGEPGLLSQAVQRHMPESVPVRGRPAERAATHGEVAELADQWGKRRTTEPFARDLLNVAERDPEFASLMQRQKTVNRSQRRLDAIEDAGKDAGSLDRPDAWNSAMTRYAGDPDAQDAYGRHYFESLVDKLNRDPATARRTFRQLLGRSDAARKGIVQMIRESPALDSNMPGVAETVKTLQKSSYYGGKSKNELLRIATDVEKQKLINEIALVANTEETLARGASNVVDFLIRRAAGVSTRWSAVTGASREVSSNYRGMPGRRK